MPHQNVDREKAARIIRDAGGRVVGRTKLQKIAYLLELAGLGDGFQFEYKHYGPYSDELASKVREAAVFDLIQVEEHPTAWGGWYSTYSSSVGADRKGHGSRSILAKEAAKVGSVELELLATAAYLSHVERCIDPWGETVRRKPEKAAAGRLEKAILAYKQLMQIQTPNPLPKIV